VDKQHRSRSMARLSVVVEHHIPDQSVQPNVCLPEGTQYHRHHQKYQNVDVVDQSAKAPSIGPPRYSWKTIQEKNRERKESKDEKKRRTCPVLSVYHSQTSLPVTDHQKVKEKEIHPTYRSRLGRSRNRTSGDNNSSTSPTQSIVVRSVYACVRACKNEKERIEKK
jgi:hypothetical protein